MRGIDEVAIGELGRRASPVTLHELSPESASLEEAFMELTEESSSTTGTLQGSTQGADR